MNVENNYCEPNCPKRHWPHAYPTPSPQQENHPDFCTASVKEMPYMHHADCPLKNTTTTAPESWEASTIEIKTAKGPVRYTLDQMFNDFELGNAVAMDLELSSSRHSAAIDWLRRNIKAFIAREIAEAEERGRREADWYGEQLLDARKSGRAAALREIQEAVPPEAKVCGCEADEDGLGYHSKDCDFTPYGFNDCRSQMIAALAALSPDKKQNHE